MQRKWTRVNTKNSNKKSIIDYAICSKTLSKDIMKVLIDDQETYKIKGKNKSDHNTIIIDIEKTVNNNKIHPKYSQKIIIQIGTHTKIQLKMKQNITPRQLSRTRTDCTQYNENNRYVQL